MKFQLLGIQVPGASSQGLGKTQKQNSEPVLAPGTWHLTSKSRGFTLIELLVVIAIIGILASIVLASLNTARQKGRDARRVSDIKQIQLALELYYDANSAYPATLAPLTAQNDIAVLPIDPSNNASYTYVPYGASATASTCTSYHLGASLEVNNNSVFNQDADLSAPPSGYVLCTASGSATSDFNGTDSVKCSSGDAGSYCYDVRP